ncbi:MOSC domain-containing protein [Crenobacter intestini]|uniref:MOSC domain-containing protein n=1 Tax=Crenobacter intestini TaxID=2563443 RepID=A0A4T0UX31_9NEIS|nr:MOSC N-terminal beta barrel domain-containing protein [Crenobacter intestini]TIC83421.1 MOSC domain-containing protein [Crenobacter intestini]
MPTLAELYVYPLKSCRGNAAARALATTAGLLHDREWLLTTPEGEFITARSDPQLVSVVAEPWPGMVLFSAPGRPPIAALATRYTGRARAQVWGDAFDARHGDARVDEWFSELIGRPCRLLWLGEASQRRREVLAEPLSFADGYPYLLANRASLAALNAAIEPPVPMRALRPNLVVDCALPWAEDGWRRLRIGDVEFEVASPCTRCVLTTIDPDTARRRTDGEPLKTLARTRRHADGVHFGVNLVARNAGTLEIGASVEVIA